MRCQEQLDDAVYLRCAYQSAYSMRNEYQGVLSMHVLQHKLLDTPSSSTQCCTSCSTPRASAHHLSLYLFLSSEKV